MDTFRQVADGVTSKGELGAAQGQRHSVAEKRRIVEETLLEGASVERARASTRTRYLAGVGCTWQGDLGNASRA